MIIESNKPGCCDFGCDEYTDLISISVLISSLIFVDVSIVAVKSLVSCLIVSELFSSVDEDEDFMEFLELVLLR